LEVIDTPLSELRAAKWNPRTIQEERFKNLIRSIEADPEFLRLRPVLATADGTIYAGNMRFRAAQQLGLETIPAIVADIPDRLAKERALRDNNQWADWDEDLLGDLLAELQGADTSIELLGFTDADLDRFLGPVEMGDEEEEEEDPVSAVLPRDPAPVNSKQGVGDPVVLFKAHVFDLDEEEDAELQTLIGRWVAATGVLFGFWNALMTEGRNGIASRED
jgi:hypothetical protein